MAARRPAMKNRMDGWQNVVNGLGVNGQDKMMSARFALRSPLTQDQQTNLFRQSWVCKRIVNELVKDATRTGFRIEFNKDPEASDKIHAAWDRLGYGWLADGMRWALVYGGAVGMLLTDGELLNSDLSLAFAEPLDRKRTTGLKNVLIADARYALPNLSAVTVDPSSSNFTLPEIYTVTPFLAGGVLPQFQTHWSRLVRFEGVAVDNLTRLGNRSWGDSIYEAVFDAVRQHGTVMAATSVTAAEFSQGVLKMKDLGLNLGSDQHAAVINRLQAFKMMLGTTGLAAVDAELEEYVRLGQPVTGLPDLIEAYKDEVCGAIGMPRSRLFGNQAGKVAGAEMDSNVWSETVHGWQMHILAAPIRYATQLLCEQEGIKGEFSIHFNDIAAPDTDKEINRRFIQAQTDKIYFEMNGLEPSEIRQSRFGGTAYSHETTLNQEISHELEEAEKASREQTEVKAEEPEDATATA
jgi:phage-related protein (TIGR01555 family)